MDYYSVHDFEPSTTGRIPVAGQPNPKLFGEY